MNLNVKHFIFSGHDTIDLANKYGTPLYVLSEDIIRENIVHIENAFRKSKLDYQIIYAGKAI